MLVPPASSHRLLQYSLHESAPNADVLTTFSVLADSNSLTCPTDKDHNNLIRLHCILGNLQ